MHQGDKHQNLTLSKSDFGSPRTSILSVPHRPWQIDQDLSSGQSRISESHQPKMSKFWKKNMCTGKKHYAFVIMQGSKKLFPNQGKLNMHCGRGVWKMLQHSASLLSLGNFNKDRPTRTIDSNILVTWRSPFGGKRCSPILMPKFYSTCLFTCAYPVFVNP